MTKKEIQLVRRIADATIRDVSFSDLKYGDFVVPLTITMFGSMPFEVALGRLIQIRKEAGSFGSDVVFVRNLNGELKCFENERFIRVVDENSEAELKKICDKYKICEIDKDGDGYNCGEEYPLRYGFLIPSEREKGYVSPTQALYEKISQILER